MPLDYSEMTLEEVLWTYSSVKGHHTRCEREIHKLLGLLKEQYSSTSENRVNDRLERLEKQTASFHTWKKQFLAYYESAHL